VSRGWRLFPRHNQALTGVEPYSDARSTARNAEPVDPAIRTTHSGQNIVECALLTGT
jgi:hypothetical protein